MNAAELLKELEDIAKGVGVEVSYDRLSGDGVRSGGLCKVKGQWKAIIERRSATTEKISVLARCLGRFEVDTDRVSEPLREILARYQPHTSSEES